MKRSLLSEADSGDMLKEGSLSLKTPLFATGKSGGAGAFNKRT